MDYGTFALTASHVAEMTPPSMQGYGDRDSRDSDVGAGERHERYLRFRSVRDFALRYRLVRRAMSAPVAPLPAPAGGGGDSEAGPAPSKGGGAGLDGAWATGGKDAALGPATLDPVRCDADLDAAASVCHTAAAAAVAADPDLAARVRAVYIASCLEHGGRLGRLALRMEDALGRSSIGSAWFTRCPSGASAGTRCRGVVGRIRSIYRGVCVHRMGSVHTMTE